MKSNYRIANMEVYKYVLRPIDSNMYVMIKNKSALIIDPHINFDVDFLLQEKDVRYIWMILTHEHFDHISGVNHFKENWTCTVICGQHAKEAVSKPEKNLSAYFRAMYMNKEQEIINQADAIFEENYSCEADIGFERVYDFKWEDVSVHLVETPGHSKGSICVIIDQDYVFTGDTLVDGNKIITRLPGGSKRDYQLITRPFLEKLSPETIIYPGHGRENNISAFEIA